MPRHVRTVCLPARPILKTVNPTSSFLRLYPDYPGFRPLGYGPGRSRFSDWHRVPRFHTVYLGSTLEVCVVETIVRDKRISRGAVMVDEALLRSLRVATITPARPLTLLDLSGANLLRQALSPNICGASDHRLSRFLAGLAHERTGWDGLYFESYQIGHINLALFDRALPKMTVTALDDLLSPAWIGTAGEVFSRYTIGIGP